MTAVRRWAVVHRLFDHLTLKQGHHAGNIAIFHELLAHQLTIAHPPNPQAMWCRCHTDAPLCVATHRLHWRAHRTASAAHLLHLHCRLLLLIGEIVAEIDVLNERQRALRDGVGQRLAAVPRDTVRLEAALLN